MTVLFIQVMTLAIAKGMASICIDKNPSDFKKFEKY